MEQNPNDDIRALFDAAVDLPAAERTRFLSGACRGDGLLKAKIEALLDCAEEDYCVIDQPLITITDRTLAIGSDGLTGAAPPLRYVGPYRIVREIGTGSMGSVYEAEQDAVSRTVAVKVLRACLSTASMMRRFEFEAQALGQLNHPYIARVFDAGTTKTEHGPQPYIAMELVRGMPLVRFAEARGLSSRQRLELLADVCDAVQHAHQKGIIHRDLKPGNILVDDDGRPHVVDFGVARAVEADNRSSTTATELGELLGTLPYMSPEQAGGRPDDIDTRTDIYALGVIGFELLTGRLPHDVGQLSLTDAIMTISDQTPPRLGTIDRNLRGDVEVIIAAAVEKEKERRYQSASDLAADLRRFLAYRPIIARPPSLVYQLSKYARRNKASFAATVTAVVLFVLGALGTSFGLFQAIEQRRVADAQRSLAVERLAQAESAQSEAEAISKLFRRVLTSAKPKRMGSDVLLTEVLESASGAIDDDVDTSPLAIARIRATLADTYRSLGKYEPAEREIRQAISLLKDHYGADHPETLAATFNLAYLYDARGDSQEAAKLYESTLETAQRALGPSNRCVLIAKSDLAAVYRSTGQYRHAEQLFLETIDQLRTSDEVERSQVLSATNNLALLYVDLGRLSEAEKLFAEVLDARERDLGPEHPLTLQALGNRAFIHASKNEYEEAERIYVRLLESRRRVMGEDHPETLSAMSNLAVVLQQQCKYGEAQKLHETVIDALGRTQGECHPATIRATQNLLTLLRDQGKYAEAEAGSRFVLETRRRVQGAAHPDTLLAMNDLASVCRELGRPEEAESLMIEAVDGARNSLGEEHPRTLTFANNLARLYQTQGRYAEAERVFQNVLAVRTRVLGDDDRSTIVSQLNLAGLYVDTRRYTEAGPLLESALNHALKAYPESHWIVGLLHRKYGQYLAGISRYADAERELVAGYETLVTSLGTEHHRVREAAATLAEFYGSTGRAQEASAWRTRSAPPTSGTSDSLSARGG